MFLELVRVDKKDDVYAVEKVLKERRGRGVRQLYVRWKGYGPDADSWITEEQLV